MTARTDGDLARGTDTGDPGPVTSTGGLDPETGASGGTIPVTGASGGGAGAEEGGGRVVTEMEETEGAPPSVQ